MEHRRSFGRYLEDFDAGDRYIHWPGRTITDHDETWFSLMTMNQNPLHVDAAFAAGSQHGQRLVNGVFVLACGVGMSAVELSGQAIANLDYEHVRHVAPTYVGDTIYARTTVLDVRPSASKPDRGVVHAETEVVNQRDEVVMTYRRHVLVKARAR
jgi:acyl dehydratase